MKSIYTYFLFITFICSFLSCGTEDIEPTLEQIKAVETSINNLEDLEGLLKGALNRMTPSGYYGRDFIINDEIRGDNVFANGNSGRFQTPGLFEYIPSNNLGIWTSAYGTIAIANIIINTDETSIEGESAAIEYIKGQALIIRALAHFDLLRNYGQQYAGGGSLGVPYVTTFKGEDLIPARNSVTEVKTAIYADLENAFSKMSSSIDDSNEKEYPNKFAAKAIESRVALYFKEWSRSENAALLVINSGLYSISEAENYLNSFSTDNAANSIFELAFSETDRLGSNSLGFIYKGEVYGDIEVLPVVEGLYEENDVRKTILGYEETKLRNLGKYSALNGDDNIPVIRYEEVILNYAEALFEQNKTNEALAQLNLIPAKRNASSYETISKSILLNERRKELIFEGFRFFDLSRSNLPIPVVHSLQNIQNPIPAGDYRYALPIPIIEIDSNSNMIQNDGY